jgi:hypothetical protein
MRFKLVFKGLNPSGNRIRTFFASAFLRSVLIFARASAVLLRRFLIYITSENPSLFSLI